jgi:hypothetical protein
MSCPVPVMHLIVGKYLLADVCIGIGRCMQTLVAKSGLLGRAEWGADQLGWHLVIRGVFGVCHRPILGRFTSRLLSVLHTPELMLNPFSDPSGTLGHGGGGL